MPITERYTATWWSNDAPGGLRPRFNPSGTSDAEAAAIALEHFWSIGQPIDRHSTVELTVEDIPPRTVRWTVEEILHWVTKGDGPTVLKDEPDISRRLQELARTLN
jgi:hypothetical protein